MRPTQILGASLLVGLSLLLGASSAGAGKPRGSTALPKTRNACNDTHVVTCKWDVRLVAESHQHFREASDSRDMDAHWSATYRNVRLGLPTAAELALSENEPEGDFIHMSGGAKGFTVGTVGFEQSGQGLPNCSWEKSYRVPTVLTIDTKLKLLTPLGNGIGSGVEPWHLLVNSYYDHEVLETGDYCKAGNTEAVELGMRESQCCRLGGPPITDVSFAPFFTTRFVLWVQKKILRRLPFPWTEFWAGRNVTVAKTWRVAPATTGIVMSGSVTITFTRRR